MHYGEVGGVESAPRSSDDHLVGLSKGFGRRNESHVNKLESLLNDWSADLQVRISKAVAIHLKVMQ